MAAVTDVDLQAAIERGLNHGMHFALAVDEAAGMARERMRQHVALAQQGDHALQDRIDVFAVGAAFGQAPELTEMHIDRQIGAASDLGRHFDDANAPARETTDLRMGLDAANDVEIGRGRLHRGVDVDAIRAVELADSNDPRARPPGRPTGTHRRATSHGSATKCRKPGNVMQDGPP